MTEKDDNASRIVTMGSAESLTAQKLEERVEELEKRELTKAPALKATATCNSCRREEKQIVAIKCAHTGLYLELECGHYLYYIQATMPSTKTAYERAK